MRRKKKNRSKRKFQGDALEKRIKTGHQKTKGYRSNVFPPDKDIPLWNPKDGQHIIDIVPYYAGKYDPASEEGDATYTFEYQMHRVGPNNTEYICPGMYGKPCPVCEYRNKLREKNDDRYKDYWPKVRNMYNVIVYDDKQETRKGVQVWDVANFYFEKPLMAISRKPSRGGKKEKTINFVHPRKGKSVTFTIDPPKSKDDYRKYVGHAFDDRDYEIDEDTIDNAFQLDSIVSRASYDEIKDTFDGSVSSKSSHSDSHGDDDMDIDDLLDILAECEDNEDLEEFMDKFDHIPYEFDEDLAFRKQKKKIKSAIEDFFEDMRYMKDAEGADDEDDDFNPELLYDLLDDCDTIKELREFVDDNDLDYKVTRKKNVGIHKKKLRKLLEDMDTTETGAVYDDDEDDDEEEDVRDEISGLSWVKLKKWVRNRDDLDIDLEDYTKSDKAELITDILEELEE